MDMPLDLPRSHGQNQLTSNQRLDLGLFIHTQNQGPIIRIKGYLSDRYGSIPVILVVLLLTGPVIFLLNFVSSWLGIAALLLALGVIIYVRMPVSEVYILSHTPEGRRSAVLGIYFFSSMEGGGILTPVMGYLIDHLGFFASYTLAASLIILTTLVCGFLLRDDLKSKQ